MATPRIAAGTDAFGVLIGSEARAALVRWFLSHPETEIPLRALAHTCGLSVTPVHRQAQKLEQIGLVESRVAGNRRRYRLRGDFPGLEALREVAGACVDPLPYLREALADLEIEVAFVFGSEAAGTASPRSDVDLLIVTPRSEEEVAGRLLSLQRRLRREIDYVVLTGEQLTARLASPSAFLMNVMRLQKLFVRGDEDVLRRLAERRDHQEAPPLPARTAGAGGGAAGAGRA